MSQKTNQYTSQKTNQYTSQKTNQSTSHKSSQYTSQNTNPKKELEINQNMKLKEIWLIELPKEEQQKLEKNLEKEIKNYELTLYVCDENEARNKIAAVKLGKLLKIDKITETNKSTASTKVTQPTASAKEPQSDFPNMLMISTSQSILDEATAKNIATIGFQLPESEDFLSADMIVEGFDEIDGTFLRHVWERHYGLPWTILETERLVVRELQLSDLDELFEMYQEKGMTDYMEGLYEYEEEKQYQKAYIENMYRFYGYGMWLVFEKNSGNLVGRAGVEHREELENEMELGYAIRTSFQRQGYATEVCRAIIQYVKAELLSNQLHCLIESGNKVSEHLAEKLGFQKKDEIILNEKQMIDYVLHL